MPAIDAPKVRPSAWWYLLIPLVLFGGVAVAIGNGIEQGTRIAESFHTLGDDGRGTIELDAGDEATVWAVWDDGRESASVTRPPAAVAVTGPGGESVAVDSPGGEKTWDSGSDSGIDLASFTADDAGEYEVAVEWEADGATGAVPTAAVGELDLAGFVVSVLRPLWTSALVALAVFVLLLVMRGRSKRRNRRVAQGQAIDTPADPAATSGPITFG